MSSDHQGTKAKTRVIKSHQAVGASFAFPALEQVAPGDLPSLSGAGTPVKPELHRKLEAELQEQLEEARRHRAEAEAAENRARALERRAAAVLQEAEEAVAARLEEAEAGVQEMLSRVTEAVEQMQAEARAQGLSEGRAEGFQAGLEAGQEEARLLLEQAERERLQLLHEAETQVAAMRTEAIAQREQILQASSSQLVDLAFAVAHQVLKAEVSLRPEAVMPMVEAALEKLKGEEEPVVRVSPSVLFVLEEQRIKLVLAAAGSRRISLEADPSLQPGDFLVQGSQGMVDGRLDQQVRVIAEQARSEER